MKQVLFNMAEQELNLRQEAFCKAYTSQDRELFGNGVQSYLEVYGLEDENGKKIDYEVAKQLAYRMLTKVHVTDRINQLLEEGGLNDQNVDKQLLFAINQHADFRTKISAIREYNNLKKRIDKKIELVLPQPILAYVQDNNSNKESATAQEENPSNSGRNVSEQNDQRGTVLDQLSSERQDANDDEHSI